MKFNIILHIFLDLGELSVTTIDSRACKISFAAHSVLLDLKPSTVTSGSSVEFMDLHRSSFLLTLRISAKLNKKPKESLMSEISYFFLHFKGET